MVRKIIHDESVLGKVSSDATIMDLGIAKDLEDTLKAHEGECVGMAANMIGVLKNIIVFENCGKIDTMFNPEIISSSGEYEIVEGCLSLEGKRMTKRFQEITVKYKDKSFKECTGNYSGFTAEIIQHEIDHIKGILI